MLTNILGFGLLAGAALMVICADGSEAAELPVVKDLTLTEARLPSSLDSKEQPVVIGVPASYQQGTALPLLVGLHTWSAEYLQMVEPYGAQAAKRKWLLVCPHFRGPNIASNPLPREAGGSILAQHDIMDAVAYMKAHYTVDERRVYLVGGSGGAHMTCLMVTKYPDVFAAGTAWCPITDLKDWHAQGNGYAAHIEAICGGKPGASPEVDFEYARRSPRTFITNAANTPLLIGHGDKDPIIRPEQSWETFRRLKDLPRHQVLFDSWSAGHDGKVDEGLNWAATKLRPVTPPRRLDIVTDEAKSYFWLTLAPSGPLTLGRCTAVLVRAGDKLGENKTAARTELTLETTDLAEASVDLKALGLGVASATPEGVTVVGTRLTVRPGAGSREYMVVF